ncbi:MAG: hypothetical protein WBA51_19525 [Erythrobacter sp.]
MLKLAFILGAPNGTDGTLSSISLRRIEAALERQRNDNCLVLLATGGFGSHFNSTDTSHRELVYRHLEAAGATIDRAEASDLLSSNTVWTDVLRASPADLFSGARGDRDGLELANADMGLDLRGGELGMADHSLDKADIGPVLEHLLAGKVPRVQHEDVLDDLEG